ncbi:MAG: CehA/McbA family metallohydrolase [Planctomycetota bacterium]
MSVTLTNPYALQGGRWLRGNLHTHTNRSDGSEEPQSVVDAYRKLGYDFLMLSDHDKITPPQGLKAGRMLLISGNEISARGPHMLHIDAKTWVEPSADRQTAIDAALHDGGLVVLNHPNWEANYDHCSLETLRRLHGFVGMEIYNAVCEFLDGSAYALDKWDRIQDPEHPVWGFANDDSHRLHHIGLGWNMVLAKSPTKAAILAALRAGRFYASTGVRIAKIAVKGSRLTVQTADATRLAVFGGKGRLLARQDGRSITFDAAAVNLPFIRVECYGAGGRCAWTQPFFVRGGDTDRRRKLLTQRPVLNVLAVTGWPAQETDWQRARSHAGFLDLKTALPAAAATQVRALTDGKRLAFRFVCHEPAMERIKTLLKLNGDPGLWTDDGLEIFLDVEGAGKSYWHLMVNANGAWYAGYSAGDRKLRGVKTQVARGADRWTLEIDLPVNGPGSLLGPAGKAAGKAAGAPDLDRWRINIGRNRAGAGVVSTWKWVGDSFHAPEHFGPLAVKS